MVCARANDGCIATLTLTAQVKGAAKTMVTVVATQELEAGDVLRRFGAGAAQHDPRRGNNNNQHSSRSSGDRRLEIVAAHGILFTCVLWFPSFFHCCTCVMMICTVFLVIFSILCKVTAHACWYLSLRYGNVFHIDKA